MIGKKCWHWSCADNNINYMLFSYRCANPIKSKYYFKSCSENMCISNKPSKASRRLKKYVTWSCKHKLIYGILNLIQQIHFKSQIKCHTFMLTVGLKMGTGSSTAELLAILEQLIQILRKMHSNIKNWTSLNTKAQKLKIYATVKGPLVKALQLQILG